MRMQKLIQVVALLFWALACSTSDKCKVGEDTSCGAEAFCYGGQTPKLGDNGVCVLRHAIHSFSPLEAPHGATLLIQGSNFFADASKTSVTLNGVLAEVLSASSDELKIQVPKNINCSGPVQVTIDERTATSAEAFTYVLTPVVSTLAGSGAAGFADGPGEFAQFSAPDGIAIDTAGNLYVADMLNHRIRKVTPEGVVSTLAGNGECDYADSDSGATAFCYPVGIAIDASNTLYVTDMFNHRIRGVTLSGFVTTIAGSGEIKDGNKGGFKDGDKNKAKFNGPIGIAKDKDGNLYVADAGNHSIRKISPEGEVSTFAGSGETGEKNGGFADGPGSVARFHAPTGVAIDTAGNLYVADYWNHRIRKISPEGEVSTLAGSGKTGEENDGFADGPGDVAQFNRPNGIAIDAAGNLYVADFGNNRIRKLTPAGVVTTLAGSTPGFAEGIGSVARFNGPWSIAIDATTGNLYVADDWNNRIRKIVFE